MFSEAQPVKDCYWSRSNVNILYQVFPMQYLLIRFNVTCKLLEVLKPISINLCVTVHVLLSGLFGCAYEDQLLLESVCVSLSHFSVDVM